MIRILAPGGQPSELTPDQLGELKRLCGREGVWADVCSPTPQEVEALQAVFPLNAFALEDALQRDHWSRFERYPEHDFLILRTLAEPEDAQSRTERASMFWQPHFLLTITNEQVGYLDEVWDERVGEAFQVQDIIYSLLDHAADAFFTHADTLREDTDALEERLFTAGGGENLAREVFNLKHAASRARRLSSGALGACVGLSRHLSGADALRLRDVQENLGRVQEFFDGVRDVLSSVLDVYLNVQNQRMNEVVKTLTTVSTIFLPLTFLAGVWGMNFAYMPELHWRYGYLFAWLSMLALGAALALYFKRRGWW